MTPPPNQETGDLPPKGRRLSVELAWDVLKDLGASEKHFNNLETEYRKLASLWLLAAFTGMGFIVKENPQMAIPRELVVLGIGLAASVGIFLVWIVDLLVYHQLLDACFEQAKKIEEDYPEFPRVRSGMEGTQGKGKVVTRRLRWFYILLTAAPVLFAAPVFCLWCQKEHGQKPAMIGAVLITLYLILTLGAIWRNCPGLKEEDAGAESSTTS